MGLRHARACARTCIRVASVKKYLALAVIATALSASPAFAGWTVQKSEADPFAPNGTSTFIAMELGEGSGLSIRCLEGAISLLLVVQRAGLRRETRPASSSSPTTRASLSAITPDGGQRASHLRHDPLHQRPIWRREHSRLPQGRAEALTSL